MTTAPGPAGTGLVLRSGDQEAAVVSTGAGLRTYRAGGHDLVDGYGPGEPAPVGKGQILMPWPNRVQAGRYVSGGREHRLDISEPAFGNAIHGLVRHEQWAVTAAGDSHAAFAYHLTGAPGYPFTLDLAVEYTLGPGGLAVRMSAHNAGDAAAPYGAGAHPYVIAGPSGVDACTLRIPAAMRWITDAAMIPVASEPVAGTDADFTSPRPIGAMRFDTCYSDLIRDADGMARTLLSGEWGVVEVWQDAAMDYLMIFSGDPFAPPQRRRSLAVEPMTCAPNAFQSGAGLVLLAPGAEHVCTWGIRPG